MSKRKHHYNVHHKGGGNMHNVVSERKRNPLLRPSKGEPDGGNGGDTEGVGALFWSIVALIVIWLIFK